MKSLEVSVWFSQRRFFCVVVHSFVSARALANMDNCPCIASFFFSQLLKLLLLKDPSFMQKTCLVPSLNGHNNPSSRLLGLINTSLCFWSITQLLHWFSVSTSFLQLNNLLPYFTSSAPSPKKIKSNFVTFIQNVLMTILRDWIIVIYHFTHNMYDFCSSPFLPLTFWQ